MSKSNSENCITSVDVGSSTIQNDVEQNVGSMPVISELLDLEAVCKSTIRPCKIRTKVSLFSHQVGDRAVVTSNEGSSIPGSIDSVASLANTTTSVGETNNITTGNNEAQLKEIPGAAATIVDPSIDGPTTDEKKSNDGEPSDNPMDVVPQVFVTDVVSNNKNKIITMPWFTISTIA